MDSTSFKSLVKAVADYFYPALVATEDMDSFLRDVRSDMRGAARAAVAECVERFDREVASALGRRWELRGRPERTVITMFGAVTYRRARYRDEDGRSRYPTDELLGVAKGARLTDDAFLWLVRRCATVSYRQAARDFADVSGAAVSAMCAWRAVQREADLIRADLASAPAGGVSQADVFCECDGIFVALQSEGRRAEAISRFLYEQSRRRASVEIKVGCVYAGVSEDGHGRRSRGNLALFATTGPAEELREGMRRTVEADYDVDDIECLHYASDGGRWCLESGLEGLGALYRQGLDLFHVMKCVVRAFPDGAGREHLVSLALRRRPEALARAVDRMIPQVEDPRRRRRMRECRDYVTNHADLLRGGGSLGTMEATNARVWAKRMKGFGLSWSRRGAGSMALVLSRVCAGRPLVAPSKGATFTEAELARSEEARARRGREAARRATCGHGFEPTRASFPHATSSSTFLPTSWGSTRVR